jgi:hypothetical protein
MRNLLIMTAAFEAATGVALLLLPMFVISLLLGASLDTPVGFALARVCGAALLSLGLVCWLARADGQSRPGRGLIAAMLVYNLIVAAILAHAGLRLGMTGIGLWPAAGTHVVLAAWCVASLRNQPAPNSI